MLQIEEIDISTAIRCDPQGNIAGLFNILCFKHSLQHLEGDGVTKNVPAQAYSYATPRVKNVLPKTDASRLIKVIKCSETRTSKQRQEVPKSAPVNKSNSPITPRTAVLPKTPLVLKTIKRESGKSDKIGIYFTPRTNRETPESAKKIKSPRLKEKLKSSTESPPKPLDASELEARGKSISSRTRSAKTNLLEKLRMPIANSTR